MPRRDPEERREYQRELMRRYGAEWRQRVLMFFGGKCEVCGNNDSRVLQLDHKHGGGNRQRRRLSSSGKQMGGNSYWMGRQALKSPAEFQLLCANHNWIKRYERGENGRNSYR